MNRKGAPGFVSIGRSVHRKTTKQRTSTGTSFKNCEMCELTNLWGRGYTSYVSQYAEFPVAAWLTTVLEEKGVSR